MNWKKILNHRIGVTAEGRPERRDGVLPEEKFRFFIEREIKKVDRNAHLFSLLIIHRRDWKDNPVFLQELLGIIQKRIRVTDQIGWLNHLSLAVFLPDTSPEGARKLAQFIHEEGGRKFPQLEFAVYTYPTDWFPDGKIRSTPSPPERVGNSSWRLSLVSKGNGERRDQNPDMQRKPIESLFFHPIPRWKRIFDIGMAVLGLVLLSPLFLLIGILIKVVSPGPVFFKQKRLGYLAIPFQFWKFRTMHVNADSRVHEEHMREIIQQDSRHESGQIMGKLDDENDPRIIPFGRWLRRSCLDELPQLYNVLRGDMSFVGPRPCMPYEAEEYHLWHSRRFDVVPGITGLWQVNGKNKTTFREMVRMDIQYTQTRSFWGDVKIILKTIAAVSRFLKDGLSKKKSLRADV